MSVRYSRNVRRHINCVRRHINWNTQGPDLKEYLAHLVGDIRRRTCGTDAEVREKAIKHFFGRALREVNKSEEAIQGASIDDCPSSTYHVISHKSI